MIILLALLVLGGLGFWMQNTAREFSGQEFLGMFICGMSWLCFLLAGVSAPFNRMGVEAGIQEYRSIQETVNQSRSDERTWESAALQQEVVEANRWRAEQQYWNSTIFDLWIPDEVEDLEPIR